MERGLEKWKEHKYMTLDAYDTLCWILWFVSMPIAIWFWHSYDWSIEKMLFDDEEEDE